MLVTAFDLAMRFVGTKETAGVTSTPLVLAMLQLDGDWPKDDAVPWCSAFANFIAWLLRLPRSKSLAAASWLSVGEGIALEQATADFCIVVLDHHVGWYAGVQGDQVLILGGNQHDAVNVSPFPKTRIVAIRRLAG